MPGILVQRMGIGRFFSGYDCTADVDERLENGVFSTAVFSLHVIHVAFMPYISVKARDHLRRN